MYNEISYQEIRAYLLGQLTPEQVKDFEKKLKVDPELAKEVEIQRELLPALERLKERELQANFQEWKKELEDDNEPPRGSWFRWYYPVITLIIVIIGSLYFNWKNNNTPTLTGESEIPPPDTTSIQVPPPNKSDSLIEKDPSIIPPKNNSKSPPKTNTLSKDSLQIVAVRNLAEDLIASIDLPKVSKVRGGKEEDAWKTPTMEADTATKLKDYEKALEILNNTTPNIPKAHLYSRLAFLYSKTKDYETAILSYKEYMKEDFDVTKTNWELALYYLASYPYYEKEFWETIDLILRLPNHPHYADAEKLVSELQEIGIER